MKRHLAPAISALVFGLATSCAATQRKDELPWQCASALVSLDHAKKLMRECKVTQINQPHQGPVLLSLTDKTTVCFIQPSIDWVFSQAKAACPSADIITVME